LSNSLIQLRRQLRRKAHLQLRSSRGRFCYRHLSADLAPWRAQSSPANAFSVPDELLTSSFTRFVRTELRLIMAGRLIGREPRHEQEECLHRQIPSEHPSSKTLPLRRSWQE